MAYENDMNCRGNDEGFYRNGIAEEILSLPAKDVLSYEKVKDPLSLLLNIEGALRNWKDVAGMLRYRPERILGDFVHHPRPGLGLLEDWIFEKKGSLRRLVQVFDELKLFSCLEVVLECVQEYEASAERNASSLSERDEYSAGFTGSYGSGVDTSLSIENSLTWTSGSMNSSNPSSPEYSTSDSLPLPDINRGCPENGRFNRTIAQENCNLSCADLEQCNSSNVPFLRVQSWSPTETRRLDRQPPNGEQSLLSRSFSQPNNLKSKAGLDNKRKSFRKRFVRIFRKKKKKPVVNSSEEVSDASLQTSTSSDGGFIRPASFTVGGAYREVAEKHCKNFSPLKVDDKRRSLDSLSSGESVPNPTSPGYESGYTSSEGPTVSCGKSISMIHCFDLEDEAYRKEGFKLYHHFNEELGYKCHLDKLEMLKVAENKFRYAVRRVKQSDFVFICVSPQLKRIFDSSVEEISDQLEDDSNSMLRLESDLILSELANSGSNRKGKFMTILLQGSSKSDVPCFLESFMVYRWPKDERKIRCIIEEQPEIMPAPVSCVKTDPPSQVVIPAKLI